VGLLARQRKSLFADWKNALATIIVVALLVRWVPEFYNWAVVRSVTQPDNDACRALDHAGACWGVIAEKYRLILFGRYPFEEQWRPLVATLLMVAMLVASYARAVEPAGLSWRGLLYWPSSSC
jgi:general L-amino acid transport system permease protein